MNFMARAAPAAPDQNKAPMKPVMVPEVMSKAVITISPDDAIAKAVDLMATGNFHHLVVSDDGKNILGIISDLDILSVKTQISDWRSTKIGEVMTPKPLSIPWQTELSVAVSTMMSKKINCLPVTNKGTLCGIVTSTDVMRFCQNLLESRNNP